jgi:hypothetical protein
LEDRVIFLAKNFIRARGICRSDDTGAVWDKVSDKAIDNILSSNLANVKMTVGNHNNVYVVIVQQETDYVNWRLKGLFQLGNSGKS